MTRETLTPVPCSICRGTRWVFIQPSWNGTVYTFGKWIPCICSLTNEKLTPNRLTD